jgi:hypothetical protein
MIVPDAYRAVALASPYHGCRPTSRCAIGPPAYEIRFPRVLSVRMATIVQCLFACIASHPVWVPMSLS